MTRKITEGNQEYIERTVYEKDPILMSKFVNSVEKLFVLCAEVQTLKTQNSYLIVKIDELERRDRDSSSSISANEQMVREYKEKLQEAEKVIAEMRAERMSDKSSNVHMRILEDQNMQLKSKLKGIETEFEAKKKKYEKRLLDLNSIYKQTLIELSTTRTNFEALKLEAGQQKPPQVQRVEKSNGRSESKQPSIPLEQYEELWEYSEDLATEMRLLKKEDSRRESDYAVKVNKFESEIQTLRDKNEELDSEVTELKIKLIKAAQQPTNLRDVEESTKQLISNNMNLEEEKYELEKMNIQLKSEVNELKSRIQQQATEFKSNFNNQVENKHLLQTEIDRLEKINELTDQKLKEANKLLLKRQKSQDDIKVFERKTSIDDIYRATSHKFGANLRESFSEDGRVRDNRSTTELVNINYDRDPIVLISQLKSAELAFKIKELNILNQEADNLDRILSSNNKFLKIIKVHNDYKLKVTKTEDFEELAHEIGIASRSRNFSRTDIVDDLIIDEEDTTINQIETLKALKHDLLAISELQNKNAENLMHQLFSKNKAIEILADLIKREISSNSNKKTGNKTPRINSFVQMYKDHPNLSKIISNIQQLQLQVSKLFEDNQKIFNVLEKERSSLRDNVMRYIGLLARYSLGGNKKKMIKTNNPVFDAQLDKQNADLKLIDAEVRHLSKINEGNQVHIEQTIETIIVKDKMIIDYLKRLDTLADESGDNFIDTHVSNRTQNSENGTYMRKEKIETSRFTSMSPEFSLPVNKPTFYGRSNADIQDAEDYSAKKTSHNAQNNSNYHKFIDTQEIHTIDQNRIDTTADPSYSRQTEYHVQQSSGINQENTVIMIEQKEQIKNPQIIKEIHYIRGERSYSPLYVQSRSIVTPYNQKFEVHVNSTNVDVDRLQKILRQKPFYVTNLNDLPQQMLDIINELEEHKYRLIKNGKDIDKFLTTIEYLSRDNNILKSKGTNREETLIMQELAILKQSLITIEKKSEVLIEENETMVRQMEQLRTENQNYRREYDKISNGYNGENDIMIMENKKLKMEIKMSQEDRNALNNMLIQLKNEYNSGKNEESNDVMYKKYQQEVKRLNEEVSKLKDTNKALKVEANKEKNEINNINKNIRMKDSELQKLQRLIDLKEKEVDFMKEKLNEVTNITDISYTSPYQGSNEPNYVKNPDGSITPVPLNENPIKKRDRDIKFLQDKIEETEVFYKHHQKQDDQKVIELKKRNDDADDRIKDLENELGEKDKELDDKDDFIKKLQDDVKNLNDGLDKLRDKANKAGGLNNELENKNKYIDDINKQLEGLKPLTRKFNDLHNLTDKLKDELKITNDKLYQTKNKLAALQEERDKLLDHLNKLGAAVNELEVVNNKKLLHISALTVKNFILLTEIERLQEQLSYPRRNRKKDRTN